MKSTSLFTIVLFFLSLSFVIAQDELPSTGSFGEEIDKKGSISAKKLAKKMEGEESLNIKVKGVVVEVCQSKGCWMTIDMGGDETMRVKFKDYGFFVPKDAAGKKATFEGVVTKELVSVEDLKHIAEDGGKSEDEIAKITKPQEELTFMADGVIIE